MNLKPRGLLALSLIGAILSALRYAPVIDDPWDRSLGSTNGAVYYGRIVQSFQRLGFRALEGAPYLYKFPTAKGLADPSLVSLQYLRHPVLSFWLVDMAVEIAGWSERSFRLVPILLSSISGGLLVLLIGRHAGAFSALAGLVLYLVLPMSYFVGWMTSYEPIALGLMLTAFIVYVRLRAAPLQWYVLSWIPVFLAGQVDWTGLFIVPAIWAYELMLPSGGRRFGRALLMGAPAVVSVFVFMAMVGVWKGSFADGFGQVWANTQHAVLHKPEKGGFGQWLANQWAFWHKFFTLPVALIAGLALPYLGWRRHSDSDALPRIALTLLVPAVLHVILFREHSFDHDFWWYYGVPYVVLATVVVLRDVSTRPAVAVAVAVLVTLAAAWSAFHGRTESETPLRSAATAGLIGVLGVGVAIGRRHPRRVAVAILLMLAAMGIDGSLARYEEVRTTEFRDLGRDFNRFANRNDALLSVAAFGFECFYLEPWYVDYVGASGLESYEQIRNLKRAGLLLVDRVVAVVPDGTAAAFKVENLERLRQIGTVRRLEPPEFLAEAPTLAHAYPGRGLWVLTID